MSFLNAYPYSNFHELNLDWILAQIKDFDSRLNSFTADVNADSKQYTDSMLVTLNNDFANFRAAVESTLSDFSDDYSELQAAIRSEVDRMQSQLDEFNRRLNSAVADANEYTQLSIANNNEYIIAETSKGLKTAQVTNYFTGEQITVQEMFNYLAGLHLDNAINYNELVDKNITYNQLADKKITYTQLAMSGNILL